jgi:hypothetical protein
VVEIRGNHGQVELGASPKAKRLGDSFNDFIGCCALEPADLHNAFFPDYRDLPLLACRRQLHHKAISITQVQRSTSGIPPNTQPK